MRIMMFCNLCLLCNEKEKKKESTFYRLYQYRSSDPFFFVISLFRNVLRNSRNIRHKNTQIHDTNGE